MEGKYLQQLVFAFFHFYICPMKGIKPILDRSLFGVCNYLAEKLGIASNRVRLYFIYVSFVTLGSPVLIYLFMAFWLNFNNYLRKGRDIIWS